MSSLFKVALSLTVVALLSLPRSARAQADDWSGFKPPPPPPTQTVDQPKPADQPAAKPADTAKPAEAKPADGAASTPDKPGYVPPPTVPVATPGTPAAAAAPEDKDAPKLIDTKVEETIVPGTEPHSPGTYSHSVTALDNVRASSGVTGGTGLLHLGSADLGRPGVLRISLTGEFFQMDNFPVLKASNTRSAGTLALDWTIIKYLAAYVSYGASANTNSKASPPLMQAQGDIRVGLKPSIQAIKGFYIGADLQFIAFPGIGGQDLRKYAVGFAPKLLLTFDAQKYSPKAPIRLHVNFGGLIDSTGTLLDTSVHTPTPAEEYALSLNQYNRLAFGAGIEAPLPFVTPFVEYGLAYPLGTGKLVGPDLKEVTVGDAMPQQLAIGLKVTAVKDLTITLAGEIGLTRYVALGVPATPPYNLYFGLAYAFDPMGQGEGKQVTKTLTYEKKVEVAVAPPVYTGKVAGQVVDADTKAPLAGVVIVAAGSGLPPVATDVEAGKFQTFDLQAGKVSLTFARDGYKPAVAEAVVEATKTTPLQVALVREIKPSPVKVLLVSNGKKAGGKVMFAGVKTAEMTVAAAGGVIELPRGPLHRHRGRRRLPVQGAGVRRGRGHQARPRHRARAQAEAGPGRHQGRPNPDQAAGPLRHCQGRDPLRQLPAARPGGRRHRARQPQEDPHRRPHRQPGWQGEEPDALAGARQGRHGLPNQEGRRRLQGLLRGLWRHPSHRPQPHRPGPRAQPPRRVRHRRALAVRARRPSRKEDRMAVRRPLLGAAVVLLATTACGPTTTTPPAPKPPKVTLSPLPYEIVGTGFDANVEVIGCTKVKRVWLTLGVQGATLVEQDGGSTSNTLRVEASFIDYKALGIPAPLPIYAHATCDTTAPQGDSLEEATLFMPAKAPITGPMPFGDNFWMDQDASGSILTCKGASFDKLGQDKTVQGSASLPFACGGDVDLTFGLDGNRYALKPGIGIASFTAAMQPKMYVSETDFAVEQIFVPASGPLVAVGVAGGLSGVIRELRGYDTSSGALVSVSDYSDQAPAGRLVVNRMGQTVFPGYKSATGSNFVEVGIEIYDMGAGKGGKPVADRTFGQILVDPLSITFIPTISFDEYADVAYIAEIADPSHVWACSAIDNLPCTDGGGGKKWRSDDLKGGVSSVTRTKHAMVAFGAHVAYFLNATTGALITPADAPIRPTGELVFVAVLDGADGSTYLLAMGTDGAGHLVPGVRQIIVYDRPNEPVANYTTGTDGYIVDVDKNGRAWLWGYDLMPLLMPAEYRQVIGR
ncbi:MAG: carboxypeptidase regulatory-like domain-containing protein [Myxococcales bacterium]